MPPSRWAESHLKTLERLNTATFPDGLTRSTTKLRILGVAIWLNVGPQVILLVAQAARGRPSVGAVRDAAGGEPPLGGLGVYAAALGQVVDSDAGPHHRL